MDAQLGRLIYNQYCINCENNDQRGGRKFEVRNGEHMAYFNFSCCEPYYKEIFGIDLPMHKISVVCKNFKEVKDD